MHLYFIRHAEAVDIASSDFERELTERGVRRTRLVGRMLSGLSLEPARIFSSPRIRARQTADIIAAALGKTVEVQESLDFDFDVEAVSRLIEPLAPEAEVIFVGHNPSMSAVVARISGASVGMKKGAVARVDIYDDIRRGELAWMITPRLLEALSS